ncbi:MAG: acetate--CoA ligase family protein [Myxococcota bacterium]
MSRDDALQTFLDPRSVAVVGASADEDSVGHAVFRNLLFGRMAGEDRAEGFSGPVYAINPKGGEILGQSVYASLSDVGEPVDLMVVAIPPRFIPDVVDEAGDVGVRSAIIISAGFGEMGEEGHALQEDLVRRARRHDMRIVGPNCLGILRPAVRLNASFAAAPPPRGRIGLVSQSGALITGIISYARAEQFGLSAAVSLGDKADVDDQDILRLLADDPETRVIALYLEAARHPREFYETLREVTPETPVVAIKAGATEAGARAASSHTGSLAGSATAYRAALTQAGVQYATSLRDFLAWSRALADQPPARGDRIAVVTNAGGPGVLAADAAHRMGLTLAPLSDETRAALDEVLPAVWSGGNPVDVIGDATPSRYREALEIVGRAPEVDGLVVIMTVQAMTDPSGTAAAIAEAHEAPSWTKPIVASFMGLEGTEVGCYLDARGVPEFDDPEMAVSAMSALVRRGRRVVPGPEPQRPARELPPPRLDDAREQVDEARAGGQRNLDLGRAREVLAAAGIRYNRSGTAGDVDEAVAVADEIGYPVVLKVRSPDVLHKSDVGGVTMDVIDADGVRRACRDMRTAVTRHQPEARIDGFVVEQQVSGTEVIVGMSRDRDFGPLLMVGMGGVFVEVYKDVSFRLVPLDRREALAMIGEIRAQPLLDGARGRPVLDRAELAEVLLRVSDLVEALPEIEELDVNPLVLTNEGLVAIDARVIVRA